MTKDIEPKQTDFLDTTVNYIFSKERRSGFDVRGKSVQELFNGIGSTIKSLEKEVAAFEEKALSDRLSGIIDSLREYSSTSNAEGIHLEFNQELEMSIDQAVLSHFSEVLGKLDNIEPKKDDYDSEDEISNNSIVTYHISSSLQIREWEEQHFIRQICTNLIVRDNLGRIIEKVKARNGKLDSWERFLYDKEGLLYTNININYSKNNSDMLIKQFACGKLKEIKKISFYCYKEDEGIYGLLSQKTNNGEVMATVTYSNNTCDPKKLGKESIPDKIKTGNIARIKYCGSFDTEEHRTRKQWDMEPIDYRNPIQLSIISDKTAKIIFPENAKAHFPLEIDLERLQQEMIQAGLFYRES
jgi:hypothetical protein